MIRFLSVLAALSLAAPAAAQPLSFEGRWAQQTAWCTSLPPGRPAPVVLTRQRLTSPAMTCDFTSVKPGGVMWRVEADCVVTETKERGSDFFGFTVLDGLLHWSWGDRTVTFHRCPD